MQTAQININVNAQGANKSVQELSNTINKAGGSAQSLRLELRKVTQELQGLEPGSARFQELSNRAGQLRDQIADTSAVIQATAGNAVERFGTALGNTVQIGVAGFQALSSAQVLFGTENEEVNKSIQKMTALLNLTQAIQTFGGLGDKITEIRAGFGLLATQQTATAVATTEATVAMEGQAVAATADAVATEGATVATSGFAVALNALPLIGIITALGFAVSALISYSNASDEAKKQEEDRKKKIEETKKAQEEESAAVVSASKDYVKLIYAIKNTTAGTKERKRAIDEVNKTYGTTLKNLSDEYAFQEQLNTSVRNYISLQVIKVRQEKNVQKIAELLDKQAIAYGELAKAEAKRDKQAKESNLTAKQVYDSFDDIRIAIDDAQKSITQYGFKIDALTLTSEQLAKEEIKLQNTFNNGNKGLQDRNTQIDKNIDKLNDYESIIKSIQSVVEDNQKLEDEIYKKRAENFDKTVDLIEVEQQTKEEAAIKQYEAIKTAIEKELTKEKIKKEEKKKLNDAIVENDKALNARLKLLGEERSLQNQIELSKQLEVYQKTYKYLIDESKALQNEIRFGDGNTTDTIIGLRNKETLAYIENLNTQLTQSKYSNKMELDEFEKLQRDRLTLLNQYATIEAQEKKTIAESEFQKILDQERTRLEELKNLKVEYIKDENGLIISSRVKIIDEEAQKIIDMNTEQRQLKLQQLNKEIEDAKKAEDQSLENSKKAEYEKFYNALMLADELDTNRELSEKNLNQTIVNLNEEKNTKILEADTELNAKLKDQTIKTEDEILDEKIKRLDEYLAYAQDAFSQASSLISQFAKQQQEIRTTQLEDAIAMDQARIESQYAQGLISREQFDNAIQQLEQKQQQEKLQIDRKNFRTEKALSLVGATIDGARAVLGAFAGTQGGIVVRTLAAALAGVFAATQIALIARQEFKAADGGIVPGTGSGDIDSVPARLAPGEAVINSRSTQAFLPLLSAINEANGGQSFVPDLPPTNQPQKFAPVFVDNQNKEPIRAYVVESDISNAQKRISRIERSTRF